MGGCHQEWRWEAELVGRKHPFVVQGQQDGKEEPADTVSVFLRKTVSTPKCLPCCYEEGVDERIGPPEPPLLGERGNVYRGGVIAVWEPLAAWYPTVMRETRGGGN